LQLPISIFEVLLKVKAEEKESKNLFAEIRAEEKEKSTHHSSCKTRQMKLSAVAVGERRDKEKKEERKRWKHHLILQSYVWEKSKKNLLKQYCKY